MSIIEAVRRDREDLARVLKKHNGIRKVVEDLYPDSAHFIYELLQNAEDTQATSAEFVLTDESLIFEHDGRPFEPRDIEAITDIGEGTKAVDDDKIGRFGVGFKSVFAYSETPHIWSPTFSFKISELVLPDRLDQRPNIGNKTRFEFPFNNPKKDPVTALSEIEVGLLELAETTLLFLTHLESISWKIGDDISGGVLRIRHSDHHFEVLKQNGGATTTSSHFLKFDQPVEGLNGQRVAVAFVLDLLPRVEQFEAAKPLAQQLRIVPAAPGQVAVFFPAAKETSGLRFHIHAPFVPELSRASIKETPANRPLFHQLASLSAASLHQIRDLGLFTADLLSVLPNPQDLLSDRYKLIRETIIEAMNSKPLTPTYARGYAPARQLLQAKASLKELLTLEDLEFLIEYEEESYQWAIGAAQKNTNADRFLAGLAIKKWDVEDFVELLKAKTLPQPTKVEPSVLPPRPDSKLMGWLSGKSLDWHQQLYALLYTQLSEDDDFDDLMNRIIVRLSNGKYEKGDSSFFPNEGVDHDDELPRVDRAVFMSGKNKSQQEKARKFLEAIGVREVGEAEQIEVLLKRRYRAEDPSPRKKDLRRFVALIDKEPQRAKTFENYCIFEGEDGKWHRPGDIYLDQPFVNSGLAVYYGVIGVQAKRYALADWYRNDGVSVERIAKFAQALGAQSLLELKKTSCTANSKWDYLKSVPGDRYATPINHDYTIEGINNLLVRPSLAISQLIWRTLVSTPKSPNYLVAIYQKNEKGGAYKADSQLVHHLRSAAWVPQSGGRFVRPAEADHDLLPEGFAYDPGWQWLKALHFGQDEVKRVENHKQRQNVARLMGLEDVESLDHAKRFVSLLTAAERERFLAEQEARRIELPEREPANPERRAERVGIQAQEAPERVFEKRLRSVAIGSEPVKEEARQYLRQQYTNHEVMICQVCKSALPFKLDDGLDYFETVSFLTRLDRQHYQNYLALCPNHAAMFQYANPSRDELHRLLKVMDGNHIEIILAQCAQSLYFTKTHIADLRAVLKANSCADETRA